MKKTFLKIIGITLALSLMLLSVFTGCAPKEKEPEENAPVNVVVNNTGANSVSDYNKETANYTLNIDAGDKIHDISDLLFGVFFEDINFAADGGLYAEMVANRSFEFTALAQNDNLYNWKAVNNADIKVTQISKDCLNENNPSYLIMKNNADDLAGNENENMDYFERYSAFLKAFNEAKTKNPKLYEGLERNGDIVEMAAYAPLFSSTVARHWAPNLIWFDNNTAMSSISYHVQKLFSLNQGSAVLKHEFDGAKIPQTDLKGQVGVGTWYTSAKFDNIVVTDNKTGEILAEDSCKLFSKTKWDFATDGKWKIKSGALTNTTTDMNYSETGSVAYFGEKDWTNYTYTVEATKLGGNEGFLIPFAVQGTDNNIFWNIGGWDNTVSCLQKITDNAKTGQINGTVKDCVIETGKTYKLKVEVNGSAVKCYIDDVLYIDYDFGTPAEAEAYTVASVDDNGDIIIKFVNTTENAKTVAIDIANAKINAKAEVNQVAGDSLQNDNVLGADESTHLTMQEFLLDGVSDKFNYTMPAYSVTSIRLKTIA